MKIDEKVYLTDLYTKILGKVEKYLDSACTTDMNPHEYWEMASNVISTLVSKIFSMFSFACTILLYDGFFFFFNHYRHKKILKVVHG